MTKTFKIIQIRKDQKNGRRLYFLYYDLFLTIEKLFIQFVIRKNVFSIIINKSTNKKVMPLFNFVHRIRRRSLHYSLFSHNRNECLIL